MYGKLGFDFDSAFEEGQVPGWEDRGAGKLPGQQGSAMDLQAFDTVDELESLGQHPYPCIIVMPMHEHPLLFPFGKDVPLQQVYPVGN